MKSEICQLSWRASLLTKRYWTETNRNFNRGPYTKNAKHEKTLSSMDHVFGFDLQCMDVETLKSKSMLVFWSQPSSVECNALIKTFHVLCHLTHSSFNLIWFDLCFHPLTMGELTVAKKNSIPGNCRVNLEIWKVHRCIANSCRFHRWRKSGPK